MLPMLREGLASAHGAIYLIATAPRAISKGKWGDRAAAGEGLLVEILVGWVKARLEVSLPEQDSPDAGAVQPGAGTASWSHENLLGFGTTGGVRSDRIKC